MYIGVTGTLASGKGEVVRILRKKGFTHFSFGEFLREEARKRSIEPTVEHLMRLANELRAQHGPGYIAEQLLHRLEGDAPRDAVFESIRHPGELAVLRRLPGFLLLSVDAPREQRWERSAHRGPREGVNSLDEFSRLEDEQLEGSGSAQQLFTVMDAADIKIVNIGNLGELEEQLDEQLNIGTRL